MPTVLRDGFEYKRRRALQVRVFKYDLGRFATQLQHALERAVGRGLLHQRAHLGRPREGHKVNVVVRGQRSTGFFAQPGHHIERAIGQAGFPGNIAKRQWREASVFGRLEHGRIAHGERRHDRAAEHLRRVVPRQDVGGDTIRLAQHHHMEVIEVGNLLAVHLVGRTTIKLAVPGRHDDVVARLRQGLAGVTRLQQRQCVDALQNNLRHPHENTAPVGGGQAAPRSAQGSPRRRHRFVNIGGVAAGQGVEHLASAGIDDRQGLPSAGGHPLTVDEMLGHSGLLRLKS